MVIQGILILIAVLFGWILRGYKVGQIQQVRQQLKKKILGDKSGVVEWKPPKSDEEIAEEEIRNKIKQ